MTGAGGLRMINYLYNVAPKDGTIHRHDRQRVPRACRRSARPGVQFDAGKMQWLGTIAPVNETMAVWHTTGVKSIDDARKRETVAGASARGAITFIYPQMMNELLGTKFKIVTGYPGGNEINLAMERGEVEARNNTWSSWKATKAAWLKDKKITVIAQAGPRARRPRCAVGRGRRPQSGGARADRAGGVRHAARPAARHQRRAAPTASPRCAPPIAATMKDPEFLAEAKSLNFEINPVLGEPMQRIVEKVLATPKPLAAKAKALME